ncbi:unnamed protein product [Orchesella dallaii]|uniref:Regulator of microtubule dynamics protein 1 n=1 Tax=Orchesella dallaii TaxID=48710 RepID=A0ABP1RBB8_9HEXA
MNSVQTDLHKMILTSDVEVDTNQQAEREAEANQSSKYSTENVAIILAKNKVDLKLLKEKALTKSVVATSVWETIVAGDKLVRLLEKEFLTDSEKLHCVELFYECAIREMNILVIPANALKKLVQIATELFQTRESTDDGDTHEAGMEMEVKIYFSYAVLNYQVSKNPFETIKLLLDGLKLYPDNIEYYDFVSFLYGVERDHSTALYYCEKGLEKFPDDANLLSGKAVHLHLAWPKAQKEEVVEAYRQFLLKAPEDHRKYPDAYYAISSLATDSVEIEHYYKLGLEAETKLLPCYLPYANSNLKKLHKRNSI